VPPEDELNIAYGVVGGASSILKTLGVLTNPLVEVLGILM
jgi:hypothetical protein